MVLLKPRDKEVLQGINVLLHKLDFINYFTTWTNHQRIWFSVLDEEGYFTKVLCDESL